mmetsp:Transcript_16558/g.58816  ORF Transcript_16558/g.58816 Transcript_16558/m.58816 type:complete len:417 (+) Transcript_16558:217-1467(+)
MPMHRKAFSETQPRSSRSNSPAALPSDSESDDEDLTPQSGGAPLLRASARRPKRCAGARATVCCAVAVFAFGGVWLVWTFGRGVKKLVCQRGGPAACIPAVSGVVFAVRQAPNSTKRPLALDLYLPEGPTKGAVLLYLHKGGFFKGAREHVPCSGSCAQFVTRDYVAPLAVKQVVGMGIAVATADYRLCSELDQPLYPAPLEDARLAVKFLRKQGYGKVGCFGMSAGAGICSALAAGGDVDAGVSIAGWADWFEQDSVKGLSCRHAAVCSAAGSNFAAGWDLGKNLSQLPQKIQRTLRLASLVSAVDQRQIGFDRLQIGFESNFTFVNASKLPSPLLLIHGEADTCHPSVNSQVLAKAYARRGATIEVALSKNVGHSICHPRRVERQAVAFVQRHLLKMAAEVAPKAKTSKWFKCR